MRTTHFIFLLICVLFPAGGLAVDFWFIGSLPSDQKTFSGEARFKFSLVPAYETRPARHSDTSGSMLLHVVNGKFAVPLATPDGKAKEFLLTSACSQDGKTFANLPDQRVVMVTLHTDKGTRARLLGPTVVDPCQDKTALPMIAGQNYVVSFQRKSSSGSISHARTTSFTIDDGMSLLPGMPSVFMTASLTLGEKETKYWVARAPLEPQANGRTFPGHEKAASPPLQLRIQPASADQYGMERNWTNTQGRKLMAAFVSADDTTLIVRTPAGILQLLPIDKLSSQDQDYLRKAIEP